MRRAQPCPAVTAGNRLGCCRGMPPNRPCFQAPHRFFARLPDYKVTIVTCFVESALLRKGIDCEQDHPRATQGAADFIGGAAKRNGPR